MEAVDEPQCAKEVKGLFVDIGDLVSRLIRDSAAPSGNDYHRSDADFVVNEVKKMRIPLEVLERDAITLGGCN